ncbi:MAG: hypothetical protein FRX49_02077 [Trebouxia sp. A1-2]|nr:MAG: hypothetical protein FRX49_02077 [Trebouxia sp. A1-2]
MSDLCQAILQACRAAGSSEEATVLCLVKTSQWAYAQCVALADLVPWQAYQRVLFHIAVPGLEIAVQGWVDSYAVGSNRQLLVDFAPQLLHVLDHLKQHGELHPWHQSPCLRAWDQLGNWQILQLTEHYAYTTAAVGGQGALASPLSYQQTDRYAHTAADQDQAESDADSGTDVAWHNCASPLDAPFEWAASLSKSPDMHAPQCADVAISNAEEGFQPLWLDGNSLTGTSHVTAPLQQQHGTIHSMEANTDSSVGAKAAFPESCFAGPTSQPFTLQPVGGKPIVDVVIDAVGNPAEPYMLRVVNSAAESTMDLHASVLVKVAPESIPEGSASGNASKGEATGNALGKEHDVRHHALEVLCFLRVDKKSGGGATKPPSPKMGSMMMAAVSSGAVCILSIHLKASWGPRQQRRASYSSKGGMLGDICAKRLSRPPQQKSGIEQAAHLRNQS